MPGGEALFNGQTGYHVVNGECACKDFPKAPQSMCKHRIASGIYKRAKTLAMQRLTQRDAKTTSQNAPGATNDRANDTRVVFQDSRGTMDLPEAPASCNVYVSIGRRRVQLTLRDSNEARLLARLEALLERFPAEDEAEQELPEGWCTKHGVQMKLRNRAHGAWYSHKTDQGWCKGK